MQWIPSLRGKRKTRKKSWSKIGLSEWLIKYHHVVHLMNALLLLRTGRKKNSRSSLTHHHVITTLRNLKNWNKKQLDRLWLETLIQKMRNLYLSLSSNLFPLRKVIRVDTLYLTEILTPILIRAISTRAELQHVSFMTRIKPMTISHCWLNLEC